MGTAWFLHPVLGTETRPCPGSRPCDNRRRHAVSFRRCLPLIDRLAGIIEGYRPDLIVTDYEFFTQMAARRLGRPCVSLDNQHLLTHCRYEPPPGHRLSRLMTLLLIRTLYSRCIPLSGHKLLRPACQGREEDPGPSPCPPARGAPLSVISGRPWADLPERRPAVQAPGDAENPHKTSL